MRSTRSSKNTTSQNSIPHKALLHEAPRLKSRGTESCPDPDSFYGKICTVFFLLFCAGFLASCQPTYPAKTLTQQLTKLAKEEENLNIICHLSGATLWVYVPLTDLIDEEKLAWNLEGVEKMNKALSNAHRVVLSTDAKIDFLAVVAADIKKFGAELIAIEYVPDIKEAMLERFSRGEFFNRSIRDVVVNPAAVGDLTGGSQAFYNISFNRFLALQIIHRTKTLFYKDKTLAMIFDLKSTSSEEKFGIIKINLEFVKKRYDLKEAQDKIKPLDYVSMIAAQVVENYRTKDFQALEITDTFANETVKLTPEALKKIKIALPELKE